MIKDDHKSSTSDIQAKTNGQALNFSNITPIKANNNNG